MSNVGLVWFGSQAVFSNILLEFSSGVNLMLSQTQLQWDMNFQYHAEMSDKTHTKVKDKHRSFLTDKGLVMGESKAPAQFHLIQTYKALATEWKSWIQKMRVKTLQTNAED